MRLPRRIAISRLESALSNTLRGVPLETWVEESVAQLIESIGQTVPPLEIESSRELLLARRIKEITYRPGIPQWGRLAIQDDGFVAEFAPSPKSSAPWLRFRLAHEVAHTFFYDIRHSPPVPLIHLEAGNRDLEWLCSYFAKCLLVPTAWLRKEIDCYPTPGSRQFSLDVLRRLQKTFSVPWRLIADRLVEDLGWWNCVLLQFVESRESGSEPREDHETSWRLKWQTIPQEGTEELFIPIGRRIDGSMKFPRAKGALRKFIVECVQTAPDRSTFERRIPKRVLNTSATGNLGKFLSELLSTDELHAYCSVRIPPQVGFLDSGGLPEPSSSVLFCFPLRPTS